MNMDEKLPYYMAYPMPLLYDDERQNQRDYEYMKSVYPGTAKRLMPYIEEECDRLEYMGSVMYDEYPDREFLYRELSKVRQRHPEETAGGKEGQDLLQVLFINEIYRRRILNRMENQSSDR